MNRCTRIVILILIASITPSLLCQDATPPKAEPISPDNEEIRAHLIDEMPIVRLDFSKFAGLEQMGVVPVEVTVDEQGNVNSAKLEGADQVDESNVPKAEREMVKTVIAEAEKAGMKLHFRPFEDSGRAVPAKFEIDIPVRDLERQPGAHIPFPPIHDWNSVKIVLSRTGCFGTCPSYEVEVQGDGSVLYTGGRFVAITGRHRASISRQAVLQLVEAFRAADYFSLKDKYIWGATDLPTYTTSISIDGKTKQVVDYAGGQVGMPESVSKLEESIDHFAGVERWTKGNSQTVPALMQEKFNFASPEASTVLASVAQMGDSDAVRDLVAAGVVVSTKMTQVGFRVPGTALDNAAWRGDVEMLRALLSTGIKDPDAKTEALARAASAGKIDAVRLLIQYGANPIASDVLVGAAASGVPAVVQEILKYKPDVNGRGQDNATALIACLGAYHYKDTGVDMKAVIRTLLDAGADPNLADNKGKTPLILNSRDLEIAQMLIEHGANVNAQAKDGFTPLLNASTVELTRLLLQHGADPFAKDDRGETALDWAKQMNRKDQAALLEGAMTGKR